MRFLARAKPMLIWASIAALAMPACAETSLYLAFVVHMHQPNYNPGAEINNDYFNSPVTPGAGTTVRQVFEDAGFCYRRPASLIDKYPDAKLTVHFTGSLMEQLDWLGQNGFTSKGTGMSGIWSDYQSAIGTGRLEALVSGYDHPIFPLITKEDAQLQYQKALKAYRDRFGKDPKGFFPPEMAFDPSITPWLSGFGLSWTLFDSFHIQGLPNKDKWSAQYCQAAFRPHLAGGGMIVVPRDHWLGQNQSDGFSPEYLLGQLAQIEKQNTDPSKPFLVTIVSDGDNGWMRQDGGGYYDWFWPGLLEALRKPENSWVKLTTVSDYLEHVYSPQDSISIERGSWGVGGANIDLSTWDSSALHKQMWANVDQVRKQLQNAPAASGDMEKAWNYFAMGETSCYWYWNNQDWANKSYAAMNLALQAAHLPNASLRQAPASPALPDPRALLLRVGADFDGIR